MQISHSLRSGGSPNLMPVFQCRQRSAIGSNAIFAKVANNQSNNQQIFTIYLISGKITPKMNDSKESNEEKVINDTQALLSKTVTSRIGLIHTPIKCRINPINSEISLMNIFGNMLAF